MSGTVTQQEPFEPESGQRNSKRKSPDGIPTTNLVLSAYVGTNAEVFPLVLGLHVPKGQLWLM